LPQLEHGHLIFPYSTTLAKANSRNYFTPFIYSSLFLQLNVVQFIQLWSLLISVNYNINRLLFHKRLLYHSCLNQKRVLIWQKHKLNI